MIGLVETITWVQDPNENCCHCTIDVCVGVKGFLFWKSGKQTLQRGPFLRKMKILVSFSKGCEEFNTVRVYPDCIVQKVFNSNHLRFLHSAIFYESEKVHFWFVKGQRSECMKVVLYQRTRDSLYPGFSTFFVAATGFYDVERWSVMTCSVVKRGFLPELGPK